MFASCTRSGRKPWRHLNRNAGARDDSNQAHVATAQKTEPVTPPQSPLAFALAVMRDDSKPEALRAGMAKAALPYLHKRGAETEETDKPKREPMSDFETARRIQHIFARADMQARREGKEPLFASETSVRPDVPPQTPREEKSAPPAPPARVQPPQPARPAPPWETEERDDGPDPHAGYRWI